MLHIEMNAPAALYLGSDWQNAREQGSRNFSSVAKAVRFAVEEVPPVSLRGALLVVDGQSLSGDAIHKLYQSADYPFPHKVNRKYRPSWTAKSLQIAH
ncbi:hypothetical protein SAMN04487974_104288 [Pelagibacterium luteolum]|uniref:Uncharacterized protein n=2 Tax=Pelagibacterium luteolum TaxID=440168 RepID=A0A1G7VQU9_9HYPH|nr:hypothetical protein SAMN04487974_104288 [Pelagibacterium luteolum]